MGRAGFLCLFLALYGCVSSSHWKHSQIDAGPFSSSRYSYLPDQQSNQLCFEVIETQRGQKGYLYVHNHPIASYQGDPTQAAVYLVTESGIPSLHLATRYQGGHRLKLSDQTLAELIHTLRTKGSVTVQASGYQTTIVQEAVSPFKK